MTLIGMTDQKYQEILAEVPEIQYLIVKAGGIATKTVVEQILMLRHNLDRGDAHTFLNINEGHNNRDFTIGQNGAQWQEHTAKRPAPMMSKYQAQFDQL